jgi:hypothetical protein
LISGLQNLASLNGSSSSLADINPANLQGLAALANLSVANGMLRTLDVYH